MLQHTAHVCFSKNDYDAYVSRLEIKEELRKSIFNNYEGFTLYYQPIVDAKSYEIKGAEALLRWNSSKYGSMSPGVFIPVMEDSGLIIPMGSHVMKEAVEVIRAAIFVDEGIKVTVEAEK